jgi:peptide/nickel transport system ATP-binding protein
MNHLLEVNNLKTQFLIEGQLIQAVDDVSYFVDEGEIIAIVGESGCGKSVSQFSILQIIPSPPGKITDGEVLFEGVDLLKFHPDGDQIRKTRGGKISVIFQEPMTSLNPVLTIGRQIIETIRLHTKLDKRAARERAIELISSVEIPDAAHRLDLYPHQLSGGLRQRVMIAMAMACNPKLLIADEPTTALDVTTQAQLLELLQDTVKRFKTSLIFITHNLGVVARIAHRVYVMYAGRIVESGTVREIFGNPLHPYTIGLLRAVPRLDEPSGRKLVAIPGLPPNLASRFRGCPFAPRCEYCMELCLEDPGPETKPVEGLHSVACHVNIREKPRVPAAEACVQASTFITEFPGANGRREEKTLLEVRNLRMSFPVTGGLLQRKVSELLAVDDVSFTIRKGETLGLVGESGCGKTTLGHCILRLYKPTSGQILLKGKDIARMPKGELLPLRREIQLIFQDPFSSLDPRQTAGSIVGEPLRVHRLVKNAAEYGQKVDELFEMVGLNPGLKGRVAHEFSGGQRQRIGIARALATKPSLLVCDEPISALDVSIQAQVINLLEDLQRKLALTYLFIAHDLSVVRHISDRVAVMYLGRVVEITDWWSLFEHPLHPYTQALLSAVPIPDPCIEVERKRIILKGEVPSLINRPTGCCFHPRCAFSTADCAHVVPTLRDVGNGHIVACHHA